MQWIRGLYEIAIPVKNLEESAAFYCDILGCTVGLNDAARRRLFLYLPGETGMIVLREDKGEWPTLHFAFEVDAADLGAATTHLSKRGVPCSAETHHQWMHAKAVYFADPDGHNLELIAIV